jgi:hypothetical protein
MSVVWHALRRGRCAALLRSAPLWVALACAGTTPPAARAREAPDARGGAPAYEVHAVRYGTLARFPVAALVAGADTGRRLDVALMVWLARAPGGRTVLLDAGFYRDKFLERWKPVDYVRPSDALAALGVRPDEVTDVIVSHVHWDHVDGADLFPRARIWIQRAEYEHHVDAAGRPRSATIDTADAAMLAALRRAGRVELVEGDSVEILPGVRVFTGGRHTFASQYAAVSTAAGPVVLAPTTPTSTRTSSGGGRSRRRSTRRATSRRRRGCSASPATRAASCRGTTRRSSRDTRRPAVGSRASAETPRRPRPRRRPADGPVRGAGRRRSAHGYTT